MPYINTITLAGHLARDVEKKYSKKGAGVTKFTLAVKRKYGKKTDFINIECWDRGNYKLSDYTDHYKKGDLVTVLGELHIDQNDGKYYTKVNADTVIGPKKSESNTTGNDNSEDFDEDFDTPF